MGDTEIMILAAVAIAAVVGAIVMILFSVRSDASAKSKGKTEQELEREAFDEELEGDGEDSSDGVDEEDCESDESESESADTSDEPVVEAYEAKIVSKRVESLVNGKNVSLRAVEFWIDFEDADGVRRSYSVTRQYFDTVNEGDEGTLVIVGGRLFDFGAGEEITEEPEAEADESEVTE